MADIFNEIEEELKQDRVRQVWRNYGKYVIAAAVLIVLSTAAYTGWRSYAKSVRADRADRFAAAISKPGEDRKEALALFTALGEEDGAGYGMLAQFRLAALKIKAGNTAQAVSIYTKIHTDGSIDTLYRDLALLLSVMVEMDDGPARPLLEKLQPQLVNGAPWRHTARELAASLALQLGQIDKAREYLTLIADDPAAPQGTRARASERLQALDG